MPSNISLYCRYGKSLSKFTDNVLVLHDNEEVRLTVRREISLSRTFAFAFDYIANIGIVLPKSQTMERAHTRLLRRYNSLPV